MKNILVNLENVAINCTTFKEAEKVLSLFDELGIKWWNGTKCYGHVSETWHKCYYEICYFFSPDNNNTLVYNHLYTCKMQRYTIKSAKWFIKNFTPKEDNSLMTKINNYVNGNVDLSDAELVKELHELQCWRHDKNTDKTIDEKIVEIRNRIKNGE